MIAKTVCARCEREVLLAPVNPGGEPGLFELEDHPTDTVAVGMRYAFNRRTAMMDDLNLLPEELHPPTCVIAHGCPVDLDALLDRDVEKKTFGGMVKYLHWKGLPRRR